MKFQSAYDDVPDLLNTGYITDPVSPITNVAKPVAGHLARWGDILGDIEKQKDLIALIEQYRNQIKIIAGYWTINGYSTGIKARGDKGDKGDAFVYEDFTEEQLKALIGPKGDKGDKGDLGEKGESGASVIKIEQGIASTEDRGVNEITFTLADGETAKIEVLNGSKGDQGNSGYTGDAIEIVNNLADERTPDFYKTSVTVPTSIDITIEELRQYEWVLTVRPIVNNSALAPTFTTSIDFSQDQPFGSLVDFLSHEYGYSGDCTLEGEELSFIMKGTSTSPFYILIEVYKVSTTLADELIFAEVLTTEVYEHAAALSSAMGKKLYDRFQVLTEDEYQALVDTNSVKEDVFYFTTED